MAPEQLISDGFSGLVKDDTAFLRRVCLLAVDEAHILNTWGAAFRKVYRQIGWIRARLQDVVLLALTASHPASFFDPAKLIGRHSRVVGKAREIQENWY
jgi:superfamily II DNA helicase RecQ